MKFRHETSAHLKGRTMKHPRQIGTGISLSGLFLICLLMSGENALAQSINDPSQSPPTIKVGVARNNDVTIWFPGSDQTIKSVEDYQGAVKSLEFGSPDLQALRVLVGPSAQGPANRRSVLGYVLDFGYSRHFVGSCINKQLRHLELRVTSNRREVSFFHMCVWREGLGLQLGALNSTNGWCWRSNINWPNVYNAIFKGLVSAGISVATATLIADIAAPIAFGALIAL